MRLVGASRWYTQLPFILEAAVAGLIGALLAIGGLVLTKGLFVDKTLAGPIKARVIPPVGWGSGEHTSELPSRPYLVFRLLLEKKKKKPTYQNVALDST